jgi:hypothetical protein
MPQDDRGIVRDLRTRALAPVQLVSGEELINPGYEWMPVKILSFFERYFDTRSMAPRQKTDRIFCGFQDDWQIHR